MPPIPDEEGSYYLIVTVNRWQFTMDQGEGDAVGTLLDGLRNGMNTPAVLPDPLFVRFTDRSGSEVRINVNHIEAFFLSTPATREADKAERARARAAKDWGEDE